MPRLALFACLAFVLLAAHCRGQDFDLGDAFDTEPTTTKKPATGSKKPTSDDGFSLEDALGGGEEPSQPQQPGGHDNSGGHSNPGGGFSDTDLIDGTLPPQKPGGRASNPSADGQGGDSKTGESAEGGGMLAGIISSVAVAVVGAVSSFIAYQKKKLCFKASDQENVNMESQQGAHAEPPVQRTLLQKS
ncbi:PREDICTED: CD99 antigen-like isoform X1 [Gekko japonicus]|uniref:CD99 antigen-like isoform X1 n=1 Tax=Gekko japonicus TaxID=146911 RepID=A0ABM1L7R5_GEKJA|nr:PREDICTED: CD99 antigen-like isoform X1 [Gekko japonicus]